MYHAEHLCIIVITLITPSMGYYNRTQRALSKPVVNFNSDQKLKKQTNRGRLFSRAFHQQTCVRVLRVDVVGSAFVSVVAGMEVVVRMGKQQRCVSVCEVENATGLHPYQDQSEEPHLWSLSLRDTPGV